MRNTPNYNLPQFDGTDKFDKDVLNDAYLKLDDAINDLQETFNLGAGDAGLLSKEVIEARKGKAKLVDKITELEEKDTSNKTELQTQIDVWNNFKANGGTIGGDVNINGNIYDSNGTKTLKRFFRNEISDDKGVPMAVALDGDGGRKRYYPSVRGVTCGSADLPWKEVFIEGENKALIGYTKLPNGIILQWGEVTINTPSNLGYYDIYYASTFPNAVLTIVPTLASLNNWNPQLCGVDISDRKTNKFTVRISLSGVAEHITFRFFAIGY